MIHTTPSAGYKWQVVQTSNSGEVVSLPAEGEPRLPVKAWATEEACRKIARLAGQDLDALRAAAEKRDFKPVPLGVPFVLIWDVRPDPRDQVKLGQQDEGKHRRR